MTTTVVLLGSPRKGNSEAIAMAMADEAKSKGNEIKVFHLAKLKNAKGCQSCYACKEKGKCIQNDDQTEILNAIREADSIICATAVYFGQPTAQFRILQDRFFSFLNGDFSPNISAGKKIATVVTCGTGIEDAKKIADSLEGMWAGFFKEVPVGKIVAGNMMPPDAAIKDAGVMAEAKAIGQKL